MTKKPSEPITQTELKLLHKYLWKYRQFDADLINQPLAGQVIGLILEWIRSDIESREGENSYQPRY